MLCKNKDCQKELEIIIQCQKVYNLYDYDVAENDFTGEYNAEDIVGKDDEATWECGSCGRQLTPEEVSELTQGQY